MKYHLIDPQDEGEIRDSAYSLWHNIWFRTLNKLDGINQLNSDSFLNADAVTVIEEDRQAIAVQIMNFHKFDKIHKNKAAIYMYKDSAWKALESYGHDVFMSYEWMCVHPDYRKTRNHHVALLLQCLSCEFQVRNEIGVAVTLTNNSRSVEKLCMSLGAERLGQDGVHHNVSVSYLVFCLEKIKNINMRKQTLKSFFNKALSVGGECIS